MGTDEALAGLAASNRTAHNFGDAKDLGLLTDATVGLAQTPTRRGYRLVTTIETAEFSRNAMEVQFTLALRGQPQVTANQVDLGKGPQTV